MGIIAQFLLFSSSILIFFTISVQSANTCKPDKCDDDLGPVVRFPFRLKNLQSIHCQYPGFQFHLYCNTKKETIINIPQSGEFIVNSINYSGQSISIKDPGSCLPKRILNFTLSDSPFRAGYTSNYTFLNCSSNSTVYSSPFRYQPLRCLSGESYTVLARNYDPNGGRPVPTNCRRVANVSVPTKREVPMFYGPTIDETGDLDLLWSDPACFNCENQGRVCGLKNVSSLEVGCYKRPTTGLPRSAKYGIIVGVGIPGLVCVIGLACYICSKIRDFRHRNRPHSALPLTSVSDQSPSIRAAGGLDKPTIESYPKTVLGESCRLPKPSDGICPICLCEYQAKEALRTIPECNHYFHADCIDEWLKLNGTCPLCRNSPDSSLATPCSSMSLSSPSLSTTSSDNQ